MYVCQHSNPYGATPYIVVYNIVCNAIANIPIPVSAALVSF